MSVHFLRYSLNIFMPSLPKVKCPQFLEIQNPWGKVMQGSVSDLKTLSNKGCKIAAR